MNEDQGIRHPNMGGVVARIRERVAVHLDRMAGRILKKIEKRKGGAA